MMCPKVLGRHFLRMVGQGYTVRKMGTVCEKIQKTVGLKGAMLRFLEH